MPKKSPKEGPSRVKDGESQDEDFGASTGATLLSSTSLTPKKLKPAENEESENESAAASDVNKNLKSSITPSTARAPLIITADDTQDPDKDEKPATPASNQISTILNLSVECKDPKINRYREKLKKHSNLGAKSQLIFPSKRAERCVIDKDLFQELLDSREKLKELKKEHATCTPRDVALLHKEIDFEENACKDEMEILEEFEVAQNEFFRQCHVNPNGVGIDYFISDPKTRYDVKHLREDFVHGYDFDVSKRDRWYENEGNILKETYQRVNDLYYLRSYTRDILKREKKRWPEYYEFEGKKWAPSHICHNNGNYWLLASPLVHFIPSYSDQSSFLLANFTPRKLYFWIRFSEYHNFEFIERPSSNSIEAHDCAKITFRYRIRKEFKGVLQRVIIYYADYEDYKKIWQRIYKETGAEVIDIRGYHTGKIVLPVFIENWEGLREVPFNKPNHDIMISMYIQRLKNKLAEHVKDEPRIRAEAIAKKMKENEDIEACRARYNKREKNRKKRSQLMDGRQVDEEMSESSLKNKKKKKGKKPDTVEAKNNVSMDIKGSTDQTKNNSVSCDMEQKKAKIKK